MTARFMWKPSALDKNEIKLAYSRDLEGFEGIRTPFAAKVMQKKDDSGIKARRRNTRLFCINYSFKPRASTEFVRVGNDWDCGARCAMHICQMVFKGSFKN